MGGGNTYNTVVWDVTEPAAPFMVPGSLGADTPQERNHRVTRPAGILLEPGRVYRLLARVARSRSTARSLPIDHGDVTVVGGLTFLDINPCLGDEFVTAPVDSGQIYLTMRFGGVSFVAHDFTRGDCTVDGVLDLADPIHFLGVQFGGGGGTFPCDDACDANDDGVLDLADAISVLDTLFLGAGPLPAPFGDCGGDPTVDDLECVTFDLCP